MINAFYVFSCHVGSHGCSHTVIISVLMYNVTILSFISIIKLNTHTHTNHKNTHKSKTQKQITNPDTHTNPNPDTHTNLNLKSIPRYTHTIPSCLITPQEPKELHISTLQHIVDVDLLWLSKRLRQKRILGNDLLVVPNLTSVKSVGSMNFLKMIYLVTTIGSCCMMSIKRSKEGIRGMKCKRTLMF